jgi:hypothetical protein
MINACARARLSTNPRATKSTSARCFAKMYYPSKNKRFFFEKKKQKTFMNLAHGRWPHHSP